MRNVIVGTAGHIDHGKSALVEALTGTNPDRWEEEKRRGITIDLGFAHLDLGNDLRISFIDVPGHERFVKNMLAGVGGIDLVLLVVAADESIMPQTREHFDICQLLGIQKGLVVVTKADLAEQEMLGLVTLEVQEFVRGSFLAGAPVVPVSSRTGAGLDRLKDALRELSFETPPKPAHRPFRLPIDRAFVMKGFGAVVTGTLISGRIEQESEVEIIPLGRRARVRGIQVHNQEAREAAAGQRTALNLAGIEARELARGMILAPPGLFQATAQLDCVLNLLPSARPLKNHARVHFHCWTAETVAEVALLEGKELKPGARAYAQLRLAEPGLFLLDDRFIIRQFSPLVTLGGGMVLDNLGARHRAGDAGVGDDLAALEHGGPEARLEILVRQAREISPAALVARTGWPAVEILRLAESLQKVKRLLALGAPPNLLVHSRYFQDLEQRVLTILGKFHAAQPLVAGLAKEDLRGRVAAELHAGRHVSPRATQAIRTPSDDSHSTLPSVQVFNAALQHLEAQEKVMPKGEQVQLAGREVKLSDEEATAKNSMAVAFETAGLAVPSAREVLQSLSIDRARAEKLLQLLLKENVLVRVADDLIFHQTSLVKLRALLARHKAQTDRLNVSVFKDLTGLSRKYAIPLLEYLDRERVTRRAGGERIIL